VLEGESGPQGCTRHAQYSSPDWDVYLLAGGFSEDGCAYTGDVSVGYPGSHADDGGNLGSASIAFDGDGAIVSCEGACSVFEGAAPVLDECTEGAVDVQRDPMPPGSCGIVRFE
jgi:hypothetical protein